MHTDLFLCTQVSSHGGELAMPSRPPVKSLAAVHEPHMTGDDPVVCMTDLSLMVHACVGGIFQVTVSPGKRPIGSTLYNF